MVFKKGYKQTQEHKDKLSLANKGKHPYIYSEERNNKISLALKGIKRGQQTQEHKRKMVETRMNNNSYIAWNKGISSIHSGSFKKGRIVLNIVKNKISDANKISWNKPELIEYAKKRRAKQTFPIKDTSIEIKIQNFLKELGITFFTHQYIQEIEHGYQCDILIPSMNLVIECDGDYWHKYPIGRDIDKIRTSELLNKGFKVLRLWERDIRNININDFENKLNCACKSN